MAPLEQLIGRINPAPNFKAAADSLAQGVKPAETIATALQNAATAAQTISGLDFGRSVNRAFGGPVGFFANGGQPRGMDTIPVMARAGESILTPEATSRWFSQIQAMNAGHAPVFRQDGGTVNNTVGDIVINGSGSPEKTARAVSRELRREFRRGSNRL